MADMPDPGMLAEVQQEINLLQSQLSNIQAQIADKTKQIRAVKKENRKRSVLGSSSGGADTQASMTKLREHQDGLAAENDIIAQLDVELEEAQEVFDEAQQGAAESSLAQTHSSPDPQRHE